MTVRMTRRGDGNAVRDLIPMALHGAPGPPNLKYLPAAVKQMETYTDGHAVGLVHRPTGAEREARALMSLRIADHDRMAAGMSYTRPPLYWITQESGLDLDRMAALAGRLTELQMLAVLPRYRGQGHGADLLRDVIERHQAFGYTALMVVVEDKADPRLLPWYAKHGFVFAPRGRPYVIRFWNDRLADAMYTHINDTQYLGMLPLAEHVTIMPSFAAGGMLTITGLLD